MRLSQLVWLIPLLMLFQVLCACPQDRQLTQIPAASNRVALVIGNGAYTKAKALPNPANDAADMAKALEGVGFEVVSGVDLDQRKMEQLIRDFGAKLAASGGVGLFYYAGHGVQVGGENYLVPVDADIPEEDEIKYKAVPVSMVLDKMATAKNELNIVILDACRNNPFARSWRGYRDGGNSDGLAKLSPPTGTLVLYATEPGKVASDGMGRNGLFTAALLKRIVEPDLEYDQLVKAVSADVWERSGKKQFPWREGNTLRDFYFAGAKGTEQKRQETAPSLPVERKPPDSNRADRITKRGTKSGRVLVVVGVIQQKGVEMDKELRHATVFTESFTSRLKQEGLTVLMFDKDDLTDREEEYYLFGIKRRSDSKAFQDLPVALILDVTIVSISDLPAYQGLRISKVTGHIDVIDTENNKTLLSVPFSDVRGFGNNQEQARFDAFKNILENIPATLFETLTEYAR